MEIDKYKRIRDMYRPKSPLNQDEETRGAMRSGRGLDLPSRVVKRAKPQEMFSAKDKENIQKGMRDLRENRAQKKKERIEKERQEAEQETRMSEQEQYIKSDEFKDQQKGIHHQFTK